MTRTALPARRACLALTLILTIALTAPLAGCAGRTSARYPSLLPRAIEARSDALPEVTAAVAEPDPVTDGALGDLRRTLDQTVVAFAPAADRAERLAHSAQGTPVGGERWIAAQSALAGLDGDRATVSATLNEIDALAVARAADVKPDYPAITALRAEAQTAFDAQSAQIAAISAMLPAE